MPPPHSELVEAAPEFSALSKQASHAPPSLASPSTTRWLAGGGAHNTQPAIIADKLLRII
jgi:hypothetical protein